MDENRLKTGHVFLFLVLLAIGACGWDVRLRAQFGPLVSPFGAPQAKSQEELDDYLNIITSTDPGQTIKLVAQFALKNPASELLGIAFQYQMLSYERLNDFDGLMRAGRTALELQPGNVNTLLTLASAIPDCAARRSDQADLFNQGEEYAKLALQGIKRTHVPRQISLQDWEKMRGQMEAQAHEALGHIAAKKGNLQEAIKELELAAYHNPTPNGSQFFRLGVAYASAGKIAPANKALERAAELGPQPVRERARDELNRISSKTQTAP